MIINEGKSIDGLDEVLIKAVVKDRKHVYVNLMALKPICDVIFKDDYLEVSYGSIK